MDKPKFEYNPDDPRSFEEQYRQWMIIADTVVLDINNYPGTAAEQGRDGGQHKGITKRDRK